MGVSKEPLAAKCGLGGFGVRAAHPAAGLRCRPLLSHAAPGDDAWWRRETQRKISVQTARPSTTKTITKSGPATHKSVLISSRA